VKSFLVQLKEFGPRRTSMKHKKSRYLHNIIAMWVKAHYGGQKMSSQILFFETMQLLTSTKLILKEVFINYTHSSKICNYQRKLHFKINIKWLKTIFVKKKCCHNIFQCKYILKMIQIIVKLDEMFIHIFNVDYNWKF
jgi:hypothetical protein